MTAKTTEPNRNSHLGLYSPLRYPGGKNCLFQFVSNLLRENDLIGTEYVEPYAGGAGLALRLLIEHKVSKIYLNDLDEWVYAFWHTILHEKKEFCTWLSTVDVQIDTWNEYRNRLSDPTSLTTFEKAQTFFFLNRTNVSGVLNGGVIGGRAQHGRYKIDARFNRSALIERIETIHGLRKQIELTNQDGTDCLRRMNSKQQKVFIYIDPPYVVKGHRLYTHYFKKADHEQLAAAIRKLHQPWLVSYDDCDLIHGLYPEYKQISYQLAQGTSNRIGEELVILSDDLVCHDSLAALKSPTIANQ